MGRGVGFDAAFSYQGNLGFQPHFGIVYTIKKKKLVPKASETPVNSTPEKPVLVPVKPN